MADDLEKPPVNVPVPGAKPMSPEEQEVLGKGDAAADKPQGEIPALPQRNSNEEPLDALAILGDAARRAYLEASKSGALDDLLKKQAQSIQASERQPGLAVPRPGKPSFDPPQPLDITAPRDRYFGKGGLREATVGGGKQSERSSETPNVADGSWMPKNWKEARP